MHSQPNHRTCQVCGDQANVFMHVVQARRWEHPYGVCEQHVNEVLERHFSVSRSTATVERTAGSPMFFEIELLIMMEGGPLDGTCYLREVSGTRILAATMDYCAAAALYWNMQPQQLAGCG